MKRLVFFLFLIYESISGLSQIDLHPFGKPDLKELQMKECAFEKEAGAMKLLDFQETEIMIFGTDLRIQIERRVRIKIFDKTGFGAANIVIPYIRHNKKSKITDITAYIYNLDSSGNIISQKLNKDQILKQKSDEGLSKVAFTFPNVKPGSVIEYRYTHNEKNSLHLNPWFFQDIFPTELSVCRFIYPIGMNFDFRLVNTDSVIKMSGINNGSIYRSSIKTFSLKNINSFRAEPMMSSVKDNLQRVEFALIPRISFLDNIINEKDRWKLYNLSLLMAPFFGGQIQNNIHGAEIILDSVKKIPVSADKVHFIYQKVKNNLKWDETYSFYADNLNEVWESKSANSAEINLTILNLLLKSGIKSYPILISTRDNGKIDPGFVSLGQFNSVDVLVVDSSDFYVLDGTQNHISYKTPPYTILNRNVLLIDTLNSKWLNISDERPLMKTSISVTAELNKTGELKGVAYISYYDHSKALKLEEKNDKEDNDKAFIEKESADLIIDSLIEENVTDELLPLIHKLNFTYKLSNTDDYFFIDPFFLSNFKKNPFNDSLRRTDIDMGSNLAYSMNIRLTIPDDYVIDDLPINLLIRASDSSMLFKREIIKQGNILLFRHSFDIQRAIFIKEEYPAIREFFRKIYNVVGDQIVLKRKK